jgi:hypothetical protein
VWKEIEEEELRWKKRGLKYSYGLNETYNLMDADGYGLIRDSDSDINGGDVEMFIDLNAE